MQNLIQKSNLDYAEYIAISEKMDGRKVRRIIFKTTEYYSDKPNSQLGELLSPKLKGHEAILQCYAIQKEKNWLVCTMDFFDKKILDILNDFSKDFNEYQIFQCAEQILSLLNFCNTNKQYFTFSPNDIVMCDNVVKIWNMSPIRNYQNELIANGRDKVISLESRVINLLSQSPESKMPIIGGFKPTLSSMIYCFGFTLWCLVNRKKFIAFLQNCNIDTYSEILKDKKQKKNPIILEEFSGECTELQKYISFCLDPNPENRPDIKKLNDWFAEFPIKKLKEVRSKISGPLQLKNSEYTTSAHEKEDNLKIRCVVPNKILFERAICDTPVYNVSNKNLKNLSLSILIDHNAVLKYYGCILKIGEPFNFFVEDFDETLLDILRDPGKDLPIEQILQFGRDIVTFAAESQQYVTFSLNWIVSCKGSLKVINNAINKVIGNAYVGKNDKWLAENNLGNEFDMLKERNTPPEIHNKNYKPALSSTIYSFGTLLLDTINPDELRTQLKICNALAADEIPKQRRPDISDIPKNCSESIKLLLLFCLDPDPEKRSDLNKFIGLIDAKIMKKLKEETGCLFSRIPEKIFVNDLLNSYFLFSPKIVESIADTKKSSHVVDSHAVALK